LFLARYMSRPLNKIVDATNLMARGDYRNTFRIKRRDEVGRLMFSFNRIKVKLLKAKQMEKTAVIGEAATAIAHELKNSLVLVDTFINLLPERHRDRKFIKEFSDTIPKELESWKSMLRGMMEFSKQKDFPKTSMNVNTVVQDVVALVHLRAKQKNIQLFVREQHNIPNVLGNTEKIKQVVLNIISNSIDATPLGGAIIVETNWLAAETKGEAEHIEIKITNTGKIISQGELNKIFNPFFTTKSQGMGLGLAISYDIIKQHNGRIDVQSNKVQGTYFSVKLPVLRKEKVEKG
ncbi:MAG: HAMP domain-containing histidine kinase, partial [Candidatus Omnitrophica bacterium]|nr:HAMP domain-containing histidine kinase [Candidatus Omnitrophota bacterium]